MNKARYAIILIFAFTAFTARTSEPSKAPTCDNHPSSDLAPDPTIDINKPRYYESEVVKIIDGDTVDLKFDIWPGITLEKRIRFDNIDTWEPRGHTKEKGLKAKEFLATLFQTEGTIYLKTTGETGNFGRTLGSLYIITEDKVINVSEELKKNGHQKTKTKSLVESMPKPPNKE